MSRDAIRALAGAQRVLILIGGYNGRGRLVIHHFGMCQDFQSRLGRLHLQVAQYQLIFLFVQFSDRFSGRSCRIDMVSSRS